MKKMHLFLTGILIIMIPYFGISGILNVPANYPTIQKAIEASSDGDIILVADGVYTGEGNINIILNDKEVVIKSANGPNKCIIDGANVLEAFGFNASFYHDSATYVSKCNTIIDGFTIQNCNNGFYISGISISPTIKNNIIKNCNCGISLYSAENVNIIGNEIRNNGISNLVIDSRIKYDKFNQPYQGFNLYRLSGGAIRIENNSSAKIQNNLIMNNIGSHAGGIYCDSNSTAEILNNDIFNNSAYFGGGITMYNPSVIVMNNIITNSTQFSNGNKLQRWNNNELFMQVTYEGGKRTGVTYYFGFKNNGETGEIKITGNVNQTFTIQSGEYYWFETTSFVTTDNQGGGISFDIQMGTEVLSGIHFEWRNGIAFGGCYYVKNTTLKSLGTVNKSTSGSGILAVSDKPFPNVAYNNIYENQGGDFILKQVIDSTNFAAIVVPDSNGNISKDSKLNSNNYSLLTGSPCIDAGNPDSKYNDASLPPGLGTVRNDMGAYGGSMNAGTAFAGGTTKVDLIKSTQSLKVYPNPVANELIIEFAGNTQKADFEVINSVGQVVLSGVILEKTVVQTASFTPGMYLIKLKSGNTFEFKKVVKI